MAFLSCFVVLFCISCYVLFVLVTVQCHRTIGLSLAWGKLHPGQFSLSFWRLKEAQVPAA